MENNVLLKINFYARLDLSGLSFVQKMSLTNPID